MIITNDEYNIIQDKKSPILFYLHFLKPSKELIKSLTKTKILQNTTVDDTYNTLIFKANKVMTLLEYLDDSINVDNTNNTNNTNNKYEQTLRLIYNISKQIEYLNNTYGKTFYNFSLNKIIVIDDLSFFYLSNEHLININKTFINNKYNYDTITITEPQKKSLLMSPELLNITYIPQEISHKSIYYTLAIVSLVFLFNLSNEEQYLYTVDNNDFKRSVNISLDTLKGSKLFSFLLRALNDPPENRTLLFA